MRMAAAVQEFTAPDGRKYWYNGTTKQSVWTKPKELIEAEEKVILQLP